MSRMAYVDDDGVIHTMAPERPDEQVSASEKTVCTWPTWSPDGSHIAYSGFRSGNNGRAHIGLYVWPSASGTSHLIYDNERGTDAIARRMPHYAIWSPDAMKLAFIAQTTRGGLSLFVHEVGASTPPRRLVDGGPLYASWSLDSRYLLVHSQQVHYLMDFEGEREAFKMPGVSSHYMAPSWSSVDSRMAIFRDTGSGRQTLLTADASGGAVRSLIEVGGISAFSWRPDGSAIGIVRDVVELSGFYPGIWLLDADRGGAQLLTDDLALCFFWSPDGAKIAYVTPSEDAEGSLRWAVMDVEARSTSYLADFRLTQEQLATFMFFDQYGQSHSPWSPDGRSLLFSGVVGYQRLRGSLPEGTSTSVYVTGLDENQVPRQVAQGFLGFWSPS